ncbi:MAG: SusD/RagB family nutrient-binding outer membrane lipoprotein [Bacteroidales bacterium]|nr:SusD/RagB family nutrient-binding outer membrane lipoprotein [Bacteroidales bacterium]
MKNIVAIILTFLVLASCTKLEELNVNIKDPTNVPGESLFTGAQLRLATVMVTPNVNRNIFRMFVQQWTETTYIDEANYDIVTRPIPGNFWDILYRDVLMNLKQSAIVLNETGTLPGDAASVLTNKLAVVEVMTVYSYAVLVETFGNVPYTEALDDAVLLPKYDDGLTIYKDLITRLSAAIASMDLAQGSMGGADNMFHGDMGMWHKFANSLKLRMGVVLFAADAATATTAITEAIASGVIGSNDDNALMAFMSSQPNNNPVNENLVLSGRNDFVAANTLVDVMNDLADPRLPLYFTTAGDPPVYVGGLYGESNDYSQFSHVAPPLLEATYPADFFDYAEVEFLLAEAAENGVAVGGTAEQHYNAGIRASILFYGGTDAEADAYLADPKVAYATAAGTWQQKIGIQKWIALYNRGFESWTAWRILNFPALVPPPDAESVVPLRLTYPTAEQTLNGANRAAAAAAIGGDDVGTRLFFDQD